MHACQMSRVSKSLKGFKNSNTLNQCLFIKDLLCEHGGWFSTHPEFSTFALHTLHEGTRPVLLNQTGSAVKNKQPIGGDVCRRIKLRMIRGAQSWKLEELLLIAASSRSTLNPLQLRTLQPCTPHADFCSFVCLLISIPDLLFHHLQPVCGAKQHFDIGHTFPIHLRFPLSSELHDKILQIL